jgi:membrane protein
MSVGGLSIAELLKRTVRGNWEDEVFGLSARLAFYHFLAIFPAVLIVLVPLAHLSAHDDLRRMLVGSFRAILPGETASLVESAIADLDKNVRAGGVLLVAGALGAAWAAMNASLAMIVGLNKAYEIEERRSWMHVTRIAAALAAAVIGLIVAALISTHYAGVAFGFAGPRLRLVVQWAAILGILIASFTLLYRFAPNLPQHEWKWTLPGATFAALLWTGFTLVMRLYFDRFASYHDIYGRVAPTAMLLLWLYGTSATVLIGGELNSEIEKGRGGAKPARR